MPRAPDLAGTALDGRYELRDMLGEGAFGRVYRGLDRRLGRPVAVKVIKPWWAEDNAWVERFEREARLLARVSDPGLVQIFDIGHAEEGPYYVAELVEGESLSDRLRDGPLAPAEAGEIAEQLCRALAGAHRQGVVHCDVKPANVLLARGGGVKVTDFGVARLAEAGSHAGDATVAGTPRYMSPEQARGRVPTPATDVYSAGIVLYEMLAGRPPFEEGSPVELGLRHLQDEPPPLPARVPGPLREIVRVAVEKDPADRYEDAGAMAAALERALAGLGASERAAAVPARAAAAVALPPAASETAPTSETAAGPETAGTALLGEPRTIDLLSPRRRADGRAPTRVKPARSGGAPPRDPDGRGTRWGLIAAVGLVLLATGAGAALLLAGAAARTTVPTLRGLPRGGVEARARRLHVRPVFSSRHDEAAAGIAVAQSPAAGRSVAQGSPVSVVLSAGPPPVAVPAVVGSAARAAESALASAGLRYAARAVAAPGSAAGTVVKQAPAAQRSVPRGSTVALSVAEAPRWRTLTSFTGVDDGSSVPFRILGSRWRVSYDMSFRGTCLLLVVCGGPSAEARNLGTGSSTGSFDLEEGEGATHTFTTGPGLYRIAVSGGRDSASWSMTVQDYY